jgi:hypothetical protein
MRWSLLLGIVYILVQLVSAELVRNKLTFNLTIGCNQNDAAIHGSVRISKGIKEINIVRGDFSIQ